MACTYSDFRVSVKLLQTKASQRKPKAVCFVNRRFSVRFRVAAFCMKALILTGLVLASILSSRSSLAQDKVATPTTMAVWGGKRKSGMGLRFMIFPSPAWMLMS